MTSVAMPFSFRRTASSTAISSNGFMLILTLAIIGRTRGVFGDQPNQCPSHDNFPTMRLVNSGNS